MDASVARRLMFAKYQLNAGKRELANNSDFGAGEAILRFHDALETFLLALADHVGLTRARIDFHQYPGRIAKHTNTTFLHVSIVNEINDLRVPTKHYGRYPPFRDVHDLAGRIDQVFEDNSAQYFGESFANVRMASTIRHPLTSSYVRKAEDAISTGEFFEGMKHLSAAFQIFMGDFRSHRIFEQPLTNAAFIDQIIGQVY
jgi:hypothetical protein